jgi:NAD(P)H dehydrogenase (quinone)
VARRTALEGARFQGRHVAEIAGKLERGAGERGHPPKVMENPTETTGGTSDDG